MTVWKLVSNDVRGTPKRSSQYDEAQVELEAGRTVFYPLEDGVDKHHFGNRLRGAFAARGLKVTAALREVDGQQGMVIWKRDDLPQVSR